MRSAPGFFMFGASASSRILTFSSLTASFSSVAASHCCRSSLSYQTARHRPSSDRAGYTVIPYSSSMTSPPPRVAARPFPLAMTVLRAVPAVVFFRRPAGRRTVPSRDACGDFVGILVRAGAACVMGLSRFLR